MWQQAESYPDPRVEIIDDHFAEMVVTHAAVERLHTGLRWAEGPVWFGDQRCLIFSDIPNNRMLKWEEETGAVSVFRRGPFTNGNTRDRQGRLISCEHGTRRVTRTELDGTITVIADSYDGKRLNSPNDVVVKSDGSIWFTDPWFGIRDWYEGYKAEPELPTNVYRVDPSGGIDAVIVDLNVADMGRLEAISIILESAPGTQVILLIDQDDERYYEAAAEKGVQACVPKQLIATELVPTVQSVLVN